ncbi:MAG: hypothetical protein JWM80_4606 [Cyanobacteria bacterium RYN_339]|nr:hypothetical protein [Cyanobacteria bacterium RYN_339]
MRFHFLLATALLAGCAHVSPTAVGAAASDPTAAAKHGPAPVKQVFDRLIGLVSPMQDAHGTLDFEFGTKGLLFSDAVRKQPTFTVNGADYQGGWGVEAGKDGKLYIPKMDGHGAKQGYLVLGSYTIPKDLKNVQFRQQVDMKIDVPYTFTVKRPLNPMAHITFVIDLQQALPEAAQAPEPVYTR